MQELIDKFEWVEWDKKDLPSASREDIERLEREIGFKIPEDYVEVVRLHPGRKPLPGKHIADGSGSSLGELYHFHGQLDSGRLGWGDFINEGTDLSLLPFSRDGGGNFFAFDYGNDPRNANPKVVFWDHETRKVTKLADSFRELLDQLNN